MDTPAHRTSKQPPMTAAAEEIPRSSPDEDPIRESLVEHVDNSRNEHVEH